MTSAMNLPELFEKFGSEENCRAYLEELRWPNGVECPRCESDSISRISTRNQLDCNQCRYRFSATSGTLFHDSHLPLSKWFMAVYLMGESKKGISAKQMERMLAVSYKTAWYLAHRIRDAMGDDDQPLLRGIVEVDETYVGGKRKGVGRGSLEGKTMVVGAVQRKGEIRLKVAGSNNRETLHGFIRENVDGDTEAVYTDEWPAYRGVSDENTRHETVNHRAEEWVRGDVHTNTVESVWSLFDRAVIGAYHKLSAKHLPAYLDEVAFRFNNRSNPYLFRDTLLRLVDADSLTYEELTA